MEDDLLYQGARLLAKWLALEIATKYGDELQPGLAEGNLSARLGVPIMEAHERYRDALPQDLLMQTDYFKEALNDILARGEEIF